MNKIKYMVAMTFYYVKQFPQRGIKNSMGILYAFIMSLWVKKNKIQYWKRHHQLNLEFLEKHLHFPVLTEEEKKVSDYHVWIMWWQGEENMPELVHRCYESIKKNSSQSVVLITKDNYQLYADLSPLIIDKVNKGIITLTNLSDYVRISLLEKNGGLWIDSTIFCSSPIPEDVFSWKLFSIHNPSYTGQYNPCGRWSGHVLGTNVKHLAWFNFMKQLWEEYWTKYDFLCDYFLIDLILEMIYNHDEGTRKLVDSIPFNNTRMFDLWNHIYDKYDEEYYMEICNNTFLHKLNYKQLDRKKACAPNCYYNIVVLKS